MTDTTLYERLLGVEHPWQVSEVRLTLEAGAVEIDIEHVGDELVCPTCGVGCPGHPSPSGSPACRAAGRPCGPSPAASALLAADPDRRVCTRA